MLLVAAGDVERNPGPPKSRTSEGEDREVSFFMHVCITMTICGNLVDDKWSNVASFELSKQSMIARTKQF